MASVCLCRTVRWTAACRRRSSSCSARPSSPEPFSAPAYEARTLNAIHQSRVTPPPRLEHLRAACVSRGGMKGGLKPRLSVPKRFSQLVQGHARLAARPVHAAAVGPRRPGGQRGPSPRPALLGRALKVVVASVGRGPDKRYSTLSGIELFSRGGVPHCALQAAPGLVAGLPTFSVSPLEYVVRTCALACPCICFKGGSPPPLYISKEAQPLPLYHLQAQSSWALLPTKASIASIPQPTALAKAPCPSSL